MYLILSRRARPTSKLGEPRPRILRGEISNHGRWRKKMQPADALRYITSKEIRDFTQRIRDLPRIGYSTKGSRARANETVEINRSELVAILQRCGVAAHGNEIYSKRRSRVYGLRLSSKYRVCRELFRVSRYQKKTQRKVS